MTSIDPFAILRAAAGDVPGVPSGDLFTGSEPVNIAAANEQATATAVAAAEPPTPAAEVSPPMPAVSILENETVAAVLALEERVRLLERMAKQNGWSL